MTNLFQYVNMFSGYLILIGLSVVGLLIIFSSVLKDTSKVLKSAIQSTSIVLFFINIIIFLFAMRLITFYTGQFTSGSDVMSFIPMIVLSFLYIIRVTLEFRNSAPRTKKGRNLKEVSSDIFKANMSYVVNTSVIFLLVISPMFFLGNGTLNGLFIRLFVSVLIIALTYIFLFPKVFNIFIKDS